MYRRRLPQDLSDHLVSPIVYLSCFSAKACHPSAYLSCNPCDFNFFDCLDSANLLGHRGFDGCTSPDKPKLSQISKPPPSPISHVLKKRRIFSHPCCPDETTKQNCLIHVVKGGIFTIIAREKKRVLC